MCRLKRKCQLTASSETEIEKDTGPCDSTSPIPSTSTRVPRSRLIVRLPNMVHGRKSRADNAIRAKGRKQHKTDQKKISSLKVQLQGKQRKVWKMERKARREKRKGPKGRKLQSL